MSYYSVIYLFSLRLRPPGNRILPDHFLWTNFEAISLCSRQCLWLLGLQILNEFSLFWACWMSAIFITKREIMVCYQFASFYPRKFDCLVSQSASNLDSYGPTYSWAYAAHHARFAAFFHAAPSKMCNMCFFFFMYLIYIYLALSSQFNLYLFRAFHAIPHLCSDVSSN